MKALFFFAGLAVVLLTSPVLAQSAVGTGTISIIRPLAITKDADLRFGTIVRPSTGSGTVTVSTAGARSVAGGVAELSSGDAPQASQFTVTGEGGQSISVTIPATFTMSNGGDTLTVTTSNNLTGLAASQSLNNALGSSGSLIFKVGGSVPIAATSVSGAYTGTFTVSAAYN